MTLWMTLYTTGVHMDQCSDGLLMAKEGHSVVHMIIARLFDAVTSYGMASELICTELMAYNWTL